MMDREQDRPSQGPSAGDPFAFRPWMLAAAVLLACALGVAIMEELRAPREMWAQATRVQSAAQR